MKRSTLILLCVLCLLALATLCACDIITPNNPNNSNKPDVSDNPTTETKQFTVSFYDEQGNLLESKKWDENSVPSYTYKKQETEQYTYDVLGWATTLDGDVLSTLPQVTQDASYYAVVRQNKKSPQIAFSGEESDSAQVKSVAATAMQSKFSVATTSMTDEEKTQAELLFNIYLLNVEKLEGNVQQVKEKANLLYAELCEALEKIGEVCETLEQIKEKALYQLETVYESLQQAVQNVSSEIQQKYQTIKQTVQSAADIQAVEDALAQFTDVAKQYVTEIVSEKVEQIITQAKAKLDGIVAEVMEKIEDASLKTQLTSFLAEQKAKLDDIVDLTEAENVVWEVTDAVAQKVQSITLEQIKQYADVVKSQLTDIVNAALEKISDLELKENLNNFYSAEIAKINAITSLDSVKETLSQIKEGVVAKAEEILLAQFNKLKENLKSQLESLISDALEKIDDEQLKSRVQNLRSTQISKIENVTDADNLQATFESIKSDIQNEIMQILQEQLVKLKTAAKAELEKIANDIIAKLEDNSLRTGLTEFLAAQKEKAEAISSMEDAKEKINQIKEDLVGRVTEISLAQIKQYGDALIAELDTVVASAINKIEDDQIRAELQSFYNAEKAKIQAISDLDTAKATLAEIKTETLAKAQELIAKALKKLKDDVKAELDAAVASALSKIDDESLRTQLQTYYNTEIEKIAEIDDIDTAKATLAEIKSDTTAMVQQILSEQLTKLVAAAKTELDNAITDALAKIDDEDLKAELQAFYTAETAKINAVDSMDGAKETLAEIKSDTTAEVKKIVGMQLSKLKNAIIADVDSQVNSALAKIDDNALKAELQSFYADEMATIQAIDSIEGAKTAATQIKNDTIAEVQRIIRLAIKKIKDNARAELDSIVAENLAKLDDNTLKAELNQFYQTEIGKIDAIDSIETAKTTAATILQDTRDFARELAARKIAALRETVKGYVNCMTTAISVSAYDYLPTAMNPHYAANLVTEQSVNINFAEDFVNVSDVNCGGFGAQWNMIVENINRMESCYSFLSKPNSVLLTAFAVVNEYLSSKYADTINYEKETDTYSLQLVYTEDTLVFKTQYKTNVSNAQLGNVNPLVEIVYNIATGENCVKIQLTSTNAIKYVVSQNKFEFGVCLGITSGNATAQCVIENKQDGTTEGKIYEFLNIAGKDVKAAAEFYVDNTYVTVVGNKADTITGFKGYVTELYNKNQGKLLGFEVKEVASGKTYDTLWFNLCDIDNLTNIKVTEKNNNNNQFSQNDTYINDKTTSFYVEIKSMLDWSRRYDFEMKYRYFYGTSDGELVKYEVQLPMLFVQEVNLKDFTTDMAKSGNNNWTTSITMPQTVLDEIMAQYNNRIDEFIQHKEDSSSSDVKAFLGLTQN